MKHKNVLLIVFLLILFVFQQAQASTKISPAEDNIVLSRANALAGAYHVYLYRLDDGTVPGHDVNRGEILYPPTRCQWPEDMQVIPPRTTVVYGCGTELAGTQQPAPNNYWIVAEDYYLKNVIALEMDTENLPVMPEALKAQAIASRTFAYWKAWWDLTYGDFAIDNSTAFQVFIPGSYSGQSAISSAVSHTTGQYLSDSDGYVINAEFASDSKDFTVTTTSPNQPYLTGVQDPISSICDSADNGHQGNPLKVRGMSQKGAIRWSKGNQCAGSGDQPWPVRWTDYRQILAHYYTGIDFLDNDAAKFAPDDRWNLLHHDAPAEMPLGNYYDNYRLVTLTIQNTSTTDWSAGEISLGWALRPACRRPTSFDPAICPCNR